ncbi:MAG: hypothetical protein U5J82_13410 [Desulfobacterales bacterium]|nr:hypothetical protein [Desulfobacterales bacterium]
MPNSQRIFYLRYALLAGFTIERIHELTGIDPWFLHQLEELVAFEGELRKTAGDLPAAAAANGQALRVFRSSSSPTSPAEAEAAVAAPPQGRRIRPVYKLVDTCAAEFQAATPYYYSTYEEENEARLSGRSESDDPGRRPEPHRPGDRIRLLLRSRLLCPAGDGD